MKKEIELSKSIEKTKKNFSHAGRACLKKLHLGEMIKCGFSTKDQQAQQRFNSGATFDPVAVQIGLPKKMLKPKSRRGYMQPEDYESLRKIKLLYCYDE